MSRLGTRTRKLLGGAACAVMLTTSGGVGAALTAAPAGAIGPGDEIECPTEAGDARYVRWLYTEVLNRCYEPSALDYWTTQLNYGISRFTLAQLFIESDEALITEATSQFRFYLPRGTEPTPGDYINAVSRMRADHTNIGLEIDLLSSDNLFGRIATDAPEQRVERWLQLTYHTMLGRDVDDAGLAWFSAYLGATPTLEQRTAVATFLARSTEGTHLRIQKAYRSTLGRMADPSGLTYWSAWLSGPGDWDDYTLEAILMASPEGDAVAQSQPNPDIVVTPL